MVENTKWAVVGGGILGMTLAYRLAQKGHQVSLFEASPKLGGLAEAWKLNGFEWDRHYHVTLLSDLHLRELLNDLDLENDMRWVQTRTGFYTDGSLYSMSDTVEFLRFPPLRLIDKLRLGGTIFYASKIKRWHRLERVLVTDWLTKFSGKRTYEKIWQPLLRAKLGENYHHASAAFIWAIIARMYAARRTGLKKEMFGYLKGGYGRMLEAYEERLRQAGVEIHKGCPVEQVQKENGQLRVRFGSNQEACFDQVGLTTPATLAARACPQLNDDERQRLNNIRYQGIICASVVIKNKDLADYYVTNITDDWVPFTAVIEMTALVNKETFGGHTLVYLPKYVTPDDPAFERSDLSIQKEFTEALLRMYPHLSEEDIVCFRVSKVRHVLALSTLNYSSQLPPISTSVPGLHIVNSAHIVNGTLNVNETVQLANQTAQSLCP